MAIKTTQLSTQWKNYPNHHLHDAVAQFVQTNSENVHHTKCKENDNGTKYIKKSKRKKNSKTMHTSAAL